MDTQQIAGLVLNKVSPRWFRLFRYGGRYPEAASVLCLSRCRLYAQKRPIAALPQMDA
jgi:hypothetical protein